MESRAGFWLRIFFQKCCFITRKGNALLWNAKSTVRGSGTDRDSESRDTECISVARYGVRVVLEGNFIVDVIHSNFALY